ELPSLTVGLLTHLHLRRFQSLRDRRDSSCCSIIPAISRLSFPFSPNSGTNLLSGNRNAARKGTGRAPGRVTTPQRTPRNSSIHFANSRALPIVADNSSMRIRGGVR